MRELLRRTVRIDRAGVELGFGARCTAGVAIPMLAAFAAGIPLDGVSAAMGALAAGFASRQGVYRTRAAAMLVTSAAMALSALVGAVAQRSPAAEVALVALWGIGFGIVGSLGMAATTAGLNAVIAILIFARVPYGPSTALVQAGCVFLGGAFQTLLLVLIWPLRRFERERRALAGAYGALAAYARDLPGTKLGSPAPEAFSALSATLADPQPFARRSEIAGFETLLDEAERIRASLAALAVGRHLLAEHGDPAGAEAARRVAELTAPILAEIAAALEAGRAPAALADAWHAADVAAATLPAPGTRDDAVAFLGEVRAAWRAAQLPAEQPAAAPVRPEAPAPFALSALGDALETLRANLSPRSVYAQHALRLGLTLLVAAILARVLPLQRAYWIALTAAILLRPDFTTTFSRGLARAAGTVAGALLASTITAFAGSSPPLSLGLAIAFAALGFTLFNVNYAIFSLAITCYVVFLLALGGAPEHLTAVDRVAATLIGAALAFAAYGLWPTWSRGRIAEAFASLLDAQRRYAMLVLRAYRDPAHADLGAVRRAQIDAWRARSAAEAAVDQMLAEPVRPREIRVRAALAILAATRRYGAAALTLHSRLARLDAPIAPPLDPLIDDLDTAYATLAAALRAHVAPPPLPPLRADQEALKRAFDADPHPELRALVAESDLLVDGAVAIAGALARNAEAAR